MELKSPFSPPTQPMTEADIPRMQSLDDADASNSPAASPPVKFRSASKPNGMFAGVENLPQSLASLQGDKNEQNPSELTILAKRFRSVTLASPAHLKSLSTTLDYAEGDAENVENFSDTSLRPSPRANHVSTPGSTSRPALAELPSGLPHLSTDEAPAQALIEMHLPIQPTSEDSQSHVHSPANAMAKSDTGGESPATPVAGGTVDAEEKEALVDSPQTRVIRSPESCEAEPPTPKSSNSIDTTENSVAAEVVEPGNEMQALDFPTHDISGSHQLAGNSVFPSQETTIFATTEIHSDETASASVSCTPVTSSSSSDGAESCPYASQTSASTSHAVCDSDNAILLTASAPGACDSSLNTPVAENTPQSSELLPYIEVLTNGTGETSWRDRAEAMDRISQALSLDAASRDGQLISSNKQPLLAAVLAHLQEIRPTIVSAAYSLLETLVSLGIVCPSAISSSVFQEALDTSSRSSVIAKSASKCAVVLFAISPKSFWKEALPLQAASNLRIACAKVQQCFPDSERLTEHASRALEALSELSDTNETMEEERPAARNSVVPIQESPDKGEIQEVAAGQLLPPQIPSTRKHESPKAVRSETKERLTPLSTIRTQRHASMGTPGSLVRGSLNLGSGGRSGEAQEKRLSARKLTPASMRKRRLYTEEEVDEARRVALRQAMEETSQVKDDKIMRLKARILQLESDRSELHGTLVEFEDTMHEMIQRENSQASKRCVDAEEETNRCKADLLEVTEAFDKLKVRYNLLKADATETATRETRVSEQLRTLKTSFVELQKWSNDLKANTEKKLKSSFESASRFRELYVERQQHEQKAAEELKACQAELVRREASLSHALKKASESEEKVAKTAAAQKILEIKNKTLSNEATVINARLEELGAELPTLREKLVKAEEEIIRLKNSQKDGTKADDKIKALLSENQNLKARAYDDLTRVKALEEQVSEKTKENDDLASMCEEALEKLERHGLSG